MVSSSFPDWDKNRSAHDKIQDISAGASSHSSLKVLQAPSETPIFRRTSVARPLSEATEFDDTDFESNFDEVEESPGKSMTSVSDNANQRHKEGRRLTGTWDRWIQRASRQRRHQERCRHQTLEGSRTSNSTSRKNLSKVHKAHISSGRRRVRTT